MAKSRSGFTLRGYHTWALALLVSVLVHVGVIYPLFMRSTLHSTPSMVTAVMMEFSDVPQSIMSIQSMNVGPPQELLKQATVKPQDSTPEKNEDVPTVNQDPVKEVTPDIVVKKKDPRQAEKKHLKVVKEKPVKHPKKRVKEPKPLPEGEVESPISNDLARVAPMGNSNKIAASFNSTSTGSSSHYNWQSLVQAKLESGLHYPEEALSKKWSGLPVVRITIDAQGNVLNASIAKSSGKEPFDREAVKNAHRQSPLPKPPETLMHSPRLTFTIPVRFRLK